MEERALERPGAGDQVHTNTFVETHMNPITTTTLPSASPLDICDASGEEMWLWFCQKLSLDPETTRQDCSGLSPQLSMDVLAEVYECKVQGNIKKSVPQFLSSLVRRARDGKFNLSAGRSIRKNLPEILLRQRALKMAEESATLTAPTEIRQSAVPPRERLRKLREELAQRGNAKYRIGVKNAS